MSDTVLVLGGGIAGIQASLDLAEAGAHVMLVEREATIGGVMAVLDKNFPTLDCSICIEAPKMSEVDLHQNIEIISMADFLSIGATLKLTSLNISTNIPPSPNITTEPKELSRLTPSITSVPFSICLAM